MVELKNCTLELFNSGKGGQGQNKRPCNVRLTHNESGITVTVRGRSKRQNVATALKTLTARLSDAKIASRAAERKARRDEKIHDRTRVRTYDQTRNIVTDHRTGKKASWKEIVEKGNLDLLR